eukprot:TRINITY_DN6923_c0_g1_i1.p1 TRINITY_DN6923_c0_g1~~TRINITY_DN6923_c0_g1_i1.p1  ORF type:complete len:444 (-),score=84.10 TRINITY_DN6923_c0_g1_i1:97-1368(-)
MHRGFFLVFTLLGFLSLIQGGEFTPEQIQITLTGSKYSMQVSWITPSADPSLASVVVFGEIKGQYDYTATGQSHSYSWRDYTSGAIHVVVLDNLDAGTKYYYRCGDQDQEMSSEFFFTTEPENPPSLGAPLRIALIADHGTSSNSVTVLKRLMQEHFENPFQFLLLSGDLSYANTNDSMWDYWGNMIGTLTPYLPWMFAPGNHELGDNLKSYQSRFHMPRTGKDGNVYYSFDYQNTHIIALNAEDDDNSRMSRQFEWLQDDLAQVDRTVTPWIIAFWHSPWYCSNIEHQTDGLKMRQEMEDLLNQYSVDICVTGHVHAYERILPIYNGELNENAPAYIVNGHGGTQEGLYNTWKPQPVWSAFREGSYYGYSTVTITNSTTLAWQMTRADTATVEDQYIMTRSSSRKRKAGPKLTKKVALISVN